MTYPIITEKYIAALRIKFGPDETAEAVYREIIPLVNMAYQAGIDGKSGYPIDPIVEIATLEAYSGRPTGDKRLMAAIINWRNEAYAQGRRDAEKVGA